MTTLFSKLKEFLPTRNNPDMVSDEVVRIVRDAKVAFRESFRQKELLELMAHSMGGMVWIKKYNLV